MAYSFVFLLSYPAGAEEAVGEVNWTAGYVSATGQGTAKPGSNRVLARIMATRAAKVSAQRNLLEQIQGVNIDSKTTIEDSVVRNDLIRSNIRGIIRGARVYSKNLEWDGDIPVVTVEMRVCLTNQSAACSQQQALTNVLELEKKEIASSAPVRALTDEMGPEAEEGVTTQELPGAVDEQSDQVEEKVVLDPNKKITGLVISLKGLAFKRSLAPVIVTALPDGTYATVYSFKAVRPRIIRTYGVVRYAESVEQATSIEYLGDNVMVVPAHEITADNFIAIGSKNARLVHESTTHGNDYLSKAKVSVSME